MDSAAEKVSGTNVKLISSYRSLTIAVSHVASASMGLQNIWERVASGQTSVIEGIIRSIPALISLATAIWTVVGAEKARTIASSIAHAVSSLGAAVPLLIAAAAAGTALALAAIASVPSREYGGRIWQTGPYLLHAGETIGGGTRTVNIYYPQFRSRSDMDELIERLRAAGVI